MNILRRFFIAFLLMNITTLIACCACSSVASDPTLNSVSELGSWQIYGYDLGNSFFSPENTLPPRGELIWQYHNAGEVSTMPVFKDDVLYVLYGTICTIVALEANTGEELWARQLDPNCAYARSLSLAGNKLYVSIDGILWTGKDGYAPVVYALDKDTGGVLWQRQTCSHWPFYVLQGFGYQISAVSSTALRERQEFPVIEIRDAATGEKFRELALPFIQSSNANLMLLDKNHIYVQKDEDIYAIDQKTYEQVWTYHIEGSRGGTKIIGDKLYISGHESIVVLDTQNGKEQLRLEDTSTWGSKEGSISAVAYDLILTRRWEDPTKPGTLYALNITQGTVQWEYPLHESTTGLVIANGRIYFGTSFIDEANTPRGKVYALDIMTGELIWVLNTPAIKYFPPIIVNGVLYAGAFTGEVLAIR